jgi:hypothetical protein
MYFFYFDESGSRDPKTSFVRADGTVVAKDHIYCLAAVGLWDGRWQRFDRAIARQKLALPAAVNRGRAERLDLADCEVKSNWLRNAKERAERSPFLATLTDDEREQLTACYYQQLEECRLSIFAVVVDKRKLQDHVTPEILHKKAYELVLERIENFMQVYHPKHNALVVMDDSDRALNRAVSMKHAFFQRQGNQNLRFRHIVEYPFFTDSELSNGVQLADLCAYNVYRAFKTADLSYPYFQLLLPRIYRRADGSRLDGLKIFPEDSELVTLARDEWEMHKKKSPALGGALR